jgi:hypothetical protein
MPVKIDPDLVMDGITVHQGKYTNRADPTVKDR